MPCTAQASTALGALSQSLVNHLHRDIRPPLAAILGFAELIEADLDQNLATVELRKAVRTIQQNGCQLLELINAIPDASAIHDTAAPPTGAAPITPPQTDPLSHEQEFLPLAGCRVLLVEHGPDHQDLLRLLLRRAGADVELAADGFEALAYQDEINRTFDLILMDMHMPRLDGYDTTTRLRQSGCVIPVIALTAHARHGDRELCMRAGCDDYIAKPIDRMTLIDTCRKWMLGDLRRAA